MSSWLYAVALLASLGLAQCRPKDAAPSEKAEAAMGRILAAPPYWRTQARKELDAGALPPSDILACLRSRTSKLGLESSREEIRSAAPPSRRSRRRRTRMRSKPS